MDHTCREDNRSDQEAIFSCGQGHCRKHMLAILPTILLSSSEARGVRNQVPGHRAPKARASDYFRTF